MPRLARRIVVDKALRRITVDGQEFPWFTVDGVDVSVTTSPSAPTVVTLSIPVDGDVAIIGEDDSVGDARDAPHLP